MATDVGIEFLCISGISNVFPETHMLGDDLAFIEHANFLPDKNYHISDDMFVTCHLRNEAQLFNINGNEHYVNKGDILLLHGGDIVQTYDSQSPGNICMLLTSVSRTIDIVKEVDLYRISLYLRNNPVLSLPPKNLDRVTVCISLLSEKISESKTDRLSHQVCYHIIFILVAEIFAAISMIDNTPTHTPYGRTETIYRRFLTELSSLQVHPREVKWYAERVCVTPKYLSEICRQQSGRPASEWIKEYAMLDIRNLMQNSTLSIKEIAIKLKYPNLSLFSKCIHRWFGMSPTRLRIQLRGS